MRHLLATIAPDLEVVAVQEIPLAMSVERAEPVTLARAPVRAGV
jgi:hypothetical protein